MGIETNHPEYQGMCQKWARMRDVVGGQDAVHAAGERYLPRLSDQTDAEYNAYKLRAGFFNASSRTLEALHGLIFRKPIVAEVPASAQFLIDDATLSSESLDDYAREATLEYLTVGRVGLMVDHPAKVETSNAAQAQALGLRSFQRIAVAESIVN